MTRRLVVLVVVLVALSLPLAMFAQEKKDAASVSITGCFNKGDSADHFVLTDEKGMKHVVTGDPAMLARHANNHKVTITGTMTKEKNQDVVKATKLDMLAVCQ